MSAHILIIQDHVDHLERMKYLPGGRIAFESQYGKESRFTVLLPES